MSFGTKESSITPESATGEPELVPPDEKFDYADLGYYIKQHINAGNHSEDQAAKLGRQTTIHRWYAGAALKIVQDRETKGRKWVEWCRAHGFNLSTCYEAIRLFKRAGGVENVQGLTISEARQRYQTDKKTYFPPGTPRPNKKVAKKSTPTRTYIETDTLIKFRTEMETIGDTVGGATTEDWNNADPDKFMGQIDKLMEMLSSAKKSIREAQKAAKTPAKNGHRPVLNDRSAAKVTGKEKADGLPAKATSARRKAVS